MCIGDMVVYKNKIDLIEKTITAGDVVLDVGFWGQGVKKDESNWPHGLIVKKAKQVDGVDLVVDVKKMHELNPRGIYISASAEDFSFKKKYTKIFAADIIEHLPNPGFFLEQCRKHLTSEGVLILSTPNAFNLFVLAGKMMHSEPVVNSDHTCYFNITTLRQLLNKCGWELVEYGYLYTLGLSHRESIRKKFLNIVYRMLFFFTQKYMETIVVVAQPKKHD